MRERCREILEQAYLILDGEKVEEWRRIEIQAHLEECSPCLQRYGLEQEVKAMIARLRGCNPCPSDLRLRITNLLDEV